ncbi:putative uncharacterized protein [Clostridium sp. CAG:356]|nr:MAG: hypothetical protein BHW02_04770 [Clostridium sp. 28_12]CDD36622.1 putative uncharacterized protein [Clostridium sp. CAG:356]
MKIDIITRHAIANYGSILQAYATEKMLDKLNIENEIIDYVRVEENSKNLVKTYMKNSKKWNRNFITRFIYKIIQKPNLDIMNNKFAKYRKKYLKLTSKQYKNKNELMEDLPQADIYCTGSDQVWGQIANDDYDENYFLEFVPNDKRCIAYSASFGKNKLSENLKIKLPKLMEKYSDIMVRELSAVKILNASGIDNVKLVLDPTLLLSKEEWEENLKIKNNEKEQYILTYQLHHNKEFDKYLKKLAKATNLKVVRLSSSIYYKFKYGKFVYLPDLEQFLTYFKNAKYVVTDSFHGTVFSIIFNKQVIDILPGKTRTRIESILKLFGMEDRIVNDYNDMSIINKEIDYKKVNDILDKERKKSIEYLRKAIERGNDE